MTRARPLPPALRGSAFSVEAARAAGVSASRLRAQDLDRTFYGVRSARTVARDVDALCRAFLPRLPASGAFSHATAARLHGMPIGPGPDRPLPLHVAVPLPRRAPHARGLAGHALKLAPHDVVELGGLPVTSPARTWRDLAAALPAPHLIAAGDAILGPGEGRCSIDELLDVLTRCRGGRGVRRAEAARRLLNPGAESAQESILRYHCVVSGLYPMVNHVVRDARGRFVARVDLAFPAERLALEYEGDHHRSDRDQWRRDIRRVERLADLGWRVMRLTALDLRAPAALTGRIASALRGRRPPDASGRPTLRVSTPSDPQSRATR